MKRLNLFLAVMLLTLVITDTAWSKNVNWNKAAQVAVNWINEKYRTTIDLDAIVKMFTVKEQSDVIYYVFNLNAGGWVIVSGDDVAYPVIGYSPVGAFNDRKKGSPAYECWMTRTKKAIRYGMLQNMPPAHAAVWEKFSLPEDDFSQQNLIQQGAAETPTDPVGPLLGSITWNQTAYYNEDCPVDGDGPGGHALTGCVATAMAQIMKYHAYPDHGYGSHSYDHATYGTQSADFGNTTYNWASMPDAISTSNAEIARLMYHCGVSVEMNYGPTGSSASTDYARDAFKNYFKYEESIYSADKTDFTDNEWSSKLQAEIDDSRPILYRGEGTGGHAFVCDSYDNSNPLLFHFNWGWGGYLNGYFLLTSLTPSDQDFTDGQSGLFGIFPATVPNHSYPYSEAFEGVEVPAEWLTSGNYAALSINDAHNGSKSLLLGDPSADPVLVDN